MYKRQVYDRLPYFYITGGDPILHKDFWKLLELLSHKNIPFAILGNPFHLNDEVCRRLKEYGCQKYQLSLDGMRQTHDWMRRPGDVYKRQPFVSSYTLTHPPKPPCCRKRLRMI